jgi:hypothetical protein
MLNEIVVEMTARLADALDFVDTAGLVIRD